MGRLLIAWLVVLLLPCWANAVVTELNSTGGTNATNGLHVYIEDTSKIQVRRLNNTGQLYSPGVVPPSNSLDNGIFLFANGLLYGPSHTVSTWSANSMYNTYSVSAVSPPNPAVAGNPQSATLSLGVTNGPQISVVWTYAYPYDFITANVTLTIPPGFAVSAANPVRYYQVVDTYLGGSDLGCGVTYTDTNGHRVLGTYPPPSGVCTSSTSVPSGVTVVESFRERSGGVPRYCVSGWANFWDKTAPLAACSIWTGQQMPNTVSTTYIDTGVAIEYDFTAAGVYNFSYDFVSGSPSTPPYDHIEIQHDGSSTNMCSTVTVLGCSTANVPCDAGQYLNSALSGTMTPTSPTATWTPAFSEAPGDLKQDIKVQFATGGIYTLGVSSPSTVPLNGTKCWNRTGLSQSCSFTAANVACTAKGLDACSNPTGSPARCAASGNRLYTKATGQNISFDLLALNAQTSGALDSNFNGQVSVDLVDGATFTASNNTCSSTTAKAGLTGTAQTITFSGGYPTNAGSYATYTVLAANNTVAAKNVRVRFTQGTLTLCSLDVFAIRPAGFALTGWSGPTQLNNAGLAGAPVADAGTDITLMANGGTGYIGTSVTGGDVILDSTSTSQNVWTHVGATDYTARLQQASSSNINNVNFSTPSSAVISATAQYHDYGLFVVKAGAVADTVFVTASGDNAGATPDCVVNSFSNTANSSGKIGCNVANQANVTIGRFAPHHFDVLGSVTPACLANTATPPGCTIGAAGCAATGRTAFTYMGQRFPAAQMQVQARSKNDLPLSKYDSIQIGALAPPPTLATPGIKAMDGGTDRSSRVTGWTTPFTWVAGVAGYSGTGLQFGRSGAPANPLNGAADGPYSVQFLVTTTGDPDRCTGTNSCLKNSLGATVANLPVIDSTGNPVAVRYGRLKLLNAVGTSSTALRMPVVAEYSKAGAWVTNTDDICTTLQDGHIAVGSGPLQATVTLSGVPKAIKSGTGQTLAAGQGTLRIPSAGGTAGWINIGLNLSGAAAAPDQTCVSGAAPSVSGDLTHLSYASTADRRWTCTSGVGGSDPWARATFGAARSTTQTIYQRENY